MFQDMLHDPVVVVLLTVIGGLAAGLISVFWQISKSDRLAKAKMCSSEKTGAITVLRPEPALSGKASRSVKRRAAPVVVTYDYDDDDDDSPTWLDRLRASIDWDSGRSYFRRYGSSALDADILPNDHMGYDGSRSSALDVDILPNGHTGYNDGFDLSGRHWSQDDGFHNPHRHGNDG